MAALSRVKRTILAGVLSGILTAVCFFGAAALHGASTGSHVVPRPVAVQCPGMALPC
jgi:hypothetical protein